MSRAAARGRAICRCFGRGLRFAPAAALLVGKLAPFAGLEIDDAMVLWWPPAGASREHAGEPAPRWRQEQGGAQNICYKARKYQQNPSEHRGNPGGFQMHRPESLP